ncbi:MAG: MBL fold metallo-hydrolase, partial [Clostridiales bacterium]|nr:MBL fold metallo-hydrolase [Clostridiales bacterium]
GMKRAFSALLVILIPALVLSAGCNGLNGADSTPDMSASTSKTSEPSTSPLQTTTTTAKERELLKIHFIDVGQGDAIFIELPDKRAVLIDGGETNMSSRVINAINAANKNRLDFVIATHPHSDHIGGLSKVIETFEIGEIYMPTIERKNYKSYQALMSAIQKKGLETKAAKAGVRILDSDALTLDILAPVKSNYADINDWSVILKLAYGSTSFLFMADATASAEKDITADVKADVLKVGFHGSQDSTSDDFLSRVAPKYAVISVGKNPYGHPSSATINKLKNADIEVYRTDLDGTITFTSDGTDITADKSK